MPSRELAEHLNELFPNRHAIAESLGIHPSLRDGFVPAGPLTAEQRAVVFPPERCAPALREIVAGSPDLGPQCPDCLNPRIDCICDQIGAAS